METRRRCPNCQPWKAASLSINNNTGLFFCFRCGARGKNSQTLRTPESEPKRFVELPKEYEPIPRKPGNLRQNLAFNYVRARKISEEELDRFLIGYCATGPYRCRVIVPIYNGKELSYFVARSYLKAEPKRYLNPPGKKNGVLFRTFHGRVSRLVVCEGVFDAIRVAKVAPAIALLGKHATPSQLNEIAKLCDQAQVMLDQDATADAYRLASEIGFYVPTSVIIPKKKDPGESTVNELKQLLGEAK